MTAMLITVVTPTASMDLSVPSTVPLSELLRDLDPTLARGAWTVSDHNGVPVDAAITLEEAGVLDGHRLFITPVSSDPPPQHSDRPTRRTPPDARAPAVVPTRPPLGARLAMTAAALAGVHRPPGTAGPIDRARAAWHWTDHTVRLRWLISKPLIRRPVIVGVLGHRSDDIAERIADTLASIRLDRVVLVDGNPGRDLTRRLPFADQGPDVIVSTLQRDGVSAVEVENLFGRTRRGTFTVSCSGSSGGCEPDMAWRLLDSLTNLAGIVVADCGEFDSSNPGMLERCDQVIATTTGGVPHVESQTIAAVWGDADHPQDVFAARSITDTEDAMTELALIAVSGWSMLDAATPVPVAP